MLRNRLVIASALAATIASNAYAYPYSDFLQPANPMHLDLTLFASGIGTDNKYGGSHEGFQFEQTVNGYVGLVGRVAAYQVWQGDSYETPVNDVTGPRNFGVFEGGADFQPLQGTSLIVLGGVDAGDSHAPRIEGDFSTWLWLHSRHPINFSFNGHHYYNNGLSGGTFDLRTVLFSARELTWLAGTGGAVWGGGPEPHMVAQFGADLGLFFRRWRSALDVQVGYGHLHTYGIVGFSRHFGWDE
jgi:hypothetical protein